jgi:2-polyprenyl-3-methyl-5-hydroxy-6-metoxy-1,4-benzoquinol methylase
MLDCLLIHLAKKSGILTTDENMKQCIICGKRRNSKKIDVNQVFGWDIMYCSKCKLGYPNDDDKKIKKAYTNFYKNDYWHTRTGERDFTTLIDKLKRWVVESGIPPLINISHYDIMRRYVAKGKLLDIGAGQGDALRFFNSKGYDVKGIEPDRINCNRINRRFRRKICEAKDAEQDRITGKFDVIYLCHVLEHFVSPMQFLVKIRKNLSEQGILFVEVPNCENPVEMKRSLSMESHVYHYTSQSLSGLFKKSGFRIVHLGIYNDVSPNLACSFFRALFQIPSYKTASSKRGRKIIVISKR